MVASNIEIVKGLQPSGIDLVAAFKGEQGAQPFPELPASAFAEDFESVFIAPDATNGPFRGLEGLVTGWLDWLEAWERYEITAEKFISAADQVVVFVRISGHTRRDGVEIEHAPAAIWTLRNGVVRRIEFYLDRNEALKAAGLAD